MTTLSNYLARPDSDPVYISTNLEEKIKVILD